MDRKNIKLVASEIRNQQIKNEKFRVAKTLRQRKRVLSKRRLVGGLNEYKLYAYLSDMFDEALILDIGTYCCDSALSFSDNPYNVVASFDTEDHIKDPNHIIYNTDNIYFKIGDFLDYSDMIMESSIILIDITHNGKDEMNILKKLYDMEYTGLLLFDDIVEFKGMKEFWDVVEFKKYDITSIGHWSGTGIIDMFDKFDIEIVK